jgi:predicted nucleic acid-binding protein
VICVDSSVGAKWVLPEEHSEQALDLYQQASQAGQEVVAPPLLPIEVCNILRQRVRRGLLTSEDARRALDRFLDFPIRLAAPSRPHSSALALADQYDLPAAYDAYYLSLAGDLGARLWTADRRLLRAIEGRLPFVSWIGDYQPATGAESET